jgi:hypothetical protein
MTRLVLALLGMAACGTSLAQFEIERFRIAGGGGQSTGGEWSLTGTIGQAEADPVALCSADGEKPNLCEGASLEINGGFWAGLEPAAPDPSCGESLQCVFRDGFETTP